jgi:hypothetical protein
LLDQPTALALDHFALLLVGLYLVGFLVIPVVLLLFLFVHPNGLDALSLSSMKRKAFSSTQYGYSHSTAVRIMGAIFATHLRGVADPLPPVPLLTQDADDAGKPVHH